MSYVNITVYYIEQEYFFLEYSQVDLSHSRYFGSNIESMVVRGSILSPNILH